MPLHAALFHHMPCNYHVISCNIMTLHAFVFHYLQITSGCNRCNNMILHDHDMLDMMLVWAAHGTASRKALNWPVQTHTYSFSQFISQQRVCLLSPEMKALKTLGHWGRGCCCLGCLGCLYGLNYCSLGP